MTALPIRDIQAFFSQLSLTPGQISVAEKIFWEIHQRLKFLMEVGLEYLTLGRLTSSLSGGEMQRIHLAASLSSSLTGTLYVLDEPSIGLHARDETRLIEILKELRNLGNTIVVVEHEKDMIEAADHIIDMGPGAGEQGGEVMHAGNPVIPAGEPALSDRKVSDRQAEDSDPDLSPLQQWETLDHPGSLPAQPPEPDGGDPSGPSGLRHGSVRIGKIHSGPGLPLCRTQETSRGVEGPGRGV